MIGGIKNMWSRKIMRAAAVGILAAALMAFPSFAHGHGHHRQAASNTDTSCPVCTVEGCTETGRHIHDDQIFVRILPSAEARKNVGEVEN